MKPLFRALVSLLVFTNSWAGEPGEAVSQFELKDVNPLSNRYQDTVSPRDYLLQVAGYYFGAAS